MLMISRCLPASLSNLSLLHQVLLGASLMPHTLGIQGYAVLFFEAIVHL